MTKIHRRTLFISSLLTGIVIGVLLSSCFSLFTRELTTGVGHTCPAPNIIPPVELEWDSHTYSNSVQLDPDLSWVDLSDDLTPMESL